MSENLRWYTKALYSMDHVVRLATPLGALAWERSTPCPAWTAAHVLGHVIAIQRENEQLINGEEVTIDPFAEPQQWCAPDPVSAWASARDDLLAALDKPNVLKRFVQSYRAYEPIDDIVGINVVDTTIHAWDLARSFGVDDRIDPTLIDHCTALITPIVETMRGEGGLGPAAPIPFDAGPQTVLLSMTGRVG